MRRKVLAEINGMPGTKRVKTTLCDPGLPKRDSHHHSASMSTTIEPSTTPCDTLDYINDEALVSKPATYIEQTTKACSNIINGTAPQRKETSCCNHYYKSKLQNSQRSNNRLKRRVSELKEIVEELQIQVPLIEYDTDDSDEAEESCCESEPANTGEESEHEPSSDYYVWSSCGNESSDDDGDWTPRIESEDSETDDEMNQNTFSDMNVDGSTSTFDQPKFVVFYTNLLSIFSLFCFNCKEPKPIVHMKRNGTMVVVKQTCSKCIFGYEWYSQPMILNKYAAGNLLLSFAILMAGASASRILLVFRHMGLCAYT